MDFINNIKIAEKTLKIIDKGSYVTDSKTFYLDDYCTESIYCVEVFDKKRLESIIKSGKDSFYKTDYCKIAIVNEDSFVAARPLVKKGKTAVMNFANALNPGGGFLQGAKAQEEALCRTSTLYASISSDKASEMYRYNLENISPLDSDYMLLSKSVVVFRDKDFSLLTSPYEVSVITIPAPNKSGRARNVSQNEIDKLMIDRLNKMLFMLASEGYKNLVLGAWGCGVFAHEAKSVAGYFYELLVDKKLMKHFDNITFAILGIGNKINAFKEIFKGEI